jgi:predicted Zn-dependent protease with MMP-like domain
MVSQDLEDAKKRIKNTVLHEVGHHFGLTDEQLRKRGY